MIQSSSSPWREILRDYFCLGLLCYAAGVTDTHTHSPTLCSQRVVPICSAPHSEGAWQILVWPGGTDSHCGIDGGWLGFLIRESTSPSPIRHILGGNSAVCQETGWHPVTHHSVPSPHTSHLPQYSPSRVCKMPPIL